MLNKNYIVSKSNLMAEMRNCNYSLGEQRLLAVFLSRINPKDPLKQRTVTFTFNEFTSLLDLKSENRTYWKKTFDSLVTKTISFEYSTDEYSAWTTCVVFSDVTLLRDEKTEELTIKLTANETVLPLIFDLSEYTRYHLSNCLRLSSSNQIRMYELLKQYENLKTRTISIEDLKEMLGMSINEYPIWERFKTKVLEVCKKALKENTDIYFEYEPIKRGRKFVKIKFLIFKNKDYKDLLNLDEFIGNQTNKDVIDVDFSDVTSSVVNDSEPIPPPINYGNDYMPEPPMDYGYDYEPEPPPMDYGYDYEPVPPPMDYGYDYIPEPPPTEKEKSTPTSVMSEPKPIEVKEHEFKESFLDEFNPEEVNLFYQLIKHKDLTKEQNDEFLQIQYSRMLVSNSKNKVNHAYNYLKSMITEEIKNYTPPIQQQDTTYNPNQIDDFTGDIDNLIKTREPNVEVQQSIYDFIKYKKDTHKHKLTDGDVEFMLEKIKTLSQGDDQKKIELIRTAMFNNWKDIFPLKEETSNNYSNGYQSNKKNQKRDYSHYKSAPRPRKQGEEINF